MNDIAEVQGWGADRAVLAKAALKKPFRFELRDDSGVLLGVLAYQEDVSKEWWEAPALEVLYLATKPGTSGVGRFLMALIAEKAAREGKDVFLAPVGTAIGFYRKLGMRFHKDCIMVWRSQEARDYVERFMAIS